MKTTLKQLVLAVLFVTGFATTKLKAQEHKANEEKTTFSVETDPSTFMLNGYAFHIRIKPKNSKHLVVGAGTYGLDMPNFLVNLNKDNKDKGWNVRINSAFSLFGEYYINEPNKQWFVGLQTGVQQYKNTNDNFSGAESKYTNMLIMPSIGYNWKPFNNGFYIKPWLGLGYTSKISGDNTINGLRYKIAPLTNFVTVHVGYTL